MITAFGKFLRNLRMDIGELLLQMAEKLDVSPAFLSGVENGKRKIPSDRVEFPQSTTSTKPKRPICKKLSTTRTIPSK